MTSRPQPWWNRAKTMRSSGMTVAEIARQMGKSAVQVGRVVSGIKCPVNRQVMTLREQNAWGAERGVVTNPFFSGKGLCRKRPLWRNQLARTKQKPSVTK